MIIRYLVFIKDPSTWALDSNVLNC
uniref:Uncharacterized protein n=1 Tax=Lepeophtheirus salmonis TaxID=72036 RepID=A0A0K2TPD1_LEPSM